MIRIVIAIVLLLDASAAWADEAAVRRMVEQKLGAGGRIESVQKAPWGGFYEVVVRAADGPLIYYVDGDAKIIFVGQAIFSDPNCPYCKRFEEILAKLDDITVHVFPYAVITPESVRQAKSVWCSNDRSKAWNDLMFRRIEPRAATACDNPIEKLVELGRQLGATSTPTWFLENGERYSGAMPLEQVRALLDTASPPNR